MNATGDADLLVAARAALLDALKALHAHLHAVIVIGAQAIYLHTGAAHVALAEATKDSDLALDPRTLAGQPLSQEAMRAAGFHLDPHARQPGAWLNDQGIPVDLMVPETLAGGPGRRGARIPPHSKEAARRAIGLEATVVHHAPMQIRALSTGDKRVYTANVAGPAALLVAKLHKLGERQGTPGRLVDKDAHDIYRLLVAVPTESLASRLRQLCQDPLAGAVSEQALAFLAELFAAGSDAPGSMMAGRTRSRRPTNSLGVRCSPRRRPPDRDRPHAKMTSVELLGHAATASCLRTPTRAVFGCAGELRVSPLQAVAPLPHSCCP